MATRRSKRWAGVSRIDQLEKRTHGFFVRLTRKGRIYNSFFADKAHGGKRKALKAARKHYAGLLRKHGAISRQAWAQIERRKGVSGILGVRKTAVKKPGLKLEYWMASWSPRPYVVQRKMFSIRKFGSKVAKALAVKARRMGVRSMEE